MLCKMNFLCLCIAWLLGVARSLMSSLPLFFFEQFNIMSRFGGLIITLFLKRHLLLITDQQVAQHKQEVTVAFSPCVICNLQKRSYFLSSEQLRVQEPSLLSNDCIVFFSALIETLENPSMSVCQLNVSY